MTYDPSNIFARILRQEIPCQALYEDAYALAFHDIQPKAPLHILVIPKGPYVDAAHFYATAPDALVLGFSRALAQVIQDLNLPKEGYRLIANSGAHGGQEVPHYHVHILGGHPLGPMLSR